MTVHGNYRSRAIQAAEDLNGDLLYRAVSFGGTIVSAASAVGRMAGLLASKASSGGMVAAAFEGEFKARAGAAITTPGYAVTVTGSGWLTAASSGGTSVGRYLGTSACASGDIVPVFIDFTNVGYFAGL